MQHIEKLLQNLQRETMNRRQLMQALALSAVAAATPEAQAAGGFKATWVNHYTYVAPDLKKTTDWYHEVFGMQIGHRDARQAHLWYGDKGGDTLMIVRQANAGEAAPRIERFAFTIDNWGKKTVEAELKRRGLQPKAEDKGFWFNDPDGYEIGVFAKDFMKRPSTPATKPALWKTLSANHIVVLSEDYKKLAAWYKDLLNLKQTTDAGRDAYQWFSDSVWIPTAARPGEKTSAALKSLDHVAYTIENYKSEDVEAELRRRKMIKPDADVKGSLGINCIDINGFKTQVCDRILVPDAEKKRPT